MKNHTRSFGKYKGREIPVSIAWVFIMDETSYWKMRYVSRKLLKYYLKIKG